jgi:hypothetical protein
VISEVVDRIAARDARTVALLGLSSGLRARKVELAERLIGKGSTSASTTRSSTPPARAVPNATCRSKLTP